jgi:hypothetical protein
VEIPWCRFTGKKKTRIALVKTADRAVELDLGVGGPEEIEIVTGDNESCALPWLKMSYQERRSESSRCCSAPTSENEFSV